MNRSLTLAALLFAFIFSGATQAAQLKPGTGSGLTIPGQSGTAPKNTPSTAAAPVAKAATATAAPLGDTATKEAEAKLAAQGWLVLLDRRDWGTAWETSATMFRTTVPLGTWMDGIPSSRKDLGKFVERVPAEAEYRSKLEGRPDGDYVTVSFDSKFEEKEIIEVVTTVRDTDGRWRVTGYLIR